MKPPFHHQLIGLLNGHFFVAKTRQGAIDFAGSPKAAAGYLVLLGIWFWHVHWALCEFLTSCFLCRLLKAWKEENRPLAQGLACHIPPSSTRVLNPGDGAS